MKKFLFICIAMLTAIALTACGEGKTEKVSSKEEVTKEEKTSAGKEEQKEEVSKEPEKKEEKKLTREEELQKKIKQIVKKNYKGTFITKIEINKNLGLDDGSYIVLPYFKWDVQNSKKTTKEMLEMYSDDLAAQLAKEKDISEITVFWEVPYHSEGNNVAKYNYTKAGDGMAVGDRSYFPPLN